MDSPTQNEAATSAALQPELDAMLERRDKEMIHRMKVVQFLGRTVPIILQNDNGPCPLLAICNVLLLKNSLSLSSDVPDVSQEKLLSLVAERLIDSNMTINTKDNSYAENQQQNISDAIDLLHRLATGIDVNLKFRRIDDFEFTPECAIFDLLDIPLYHGWIVDPQDSETAGAVGSKSYNSLMGELVSLDTQNSVDFVAATTAALGVPSPSLSRVQSFDDFPHRTKKGDAEEVSDLLRVLKLSESETSATLNHDAVADAYLSETKNVKEPHTVMDSGNIGNDNTIHTSDNLKLTRNDREVLTDTEDDVISAGVLPDEAKCLLQKSDIGCSIQNANEESGKHRDYTDPDTRAECDMVQPPSIWKDSAPPDHSHVMQTSNDDCQNISTTRSDGDEKDLHTSLDEASESDLSSGHKDHSDKPGALSSVVGINEPMYEGEECILESGGVVYETREPVYEGEAALAEQVDKGQIDENCTNKEKISLKEGEIIRNFFKNSASQLTIYGLFCLQDKVKERELCVFFRNNHFNTMFKFKGELYILATDQGYISQPDLVWEKLNEVNGDTVFVTGNFEEFKMNEQSSSTWDEMNVMASTADYLANIESTQENSSFNSDLQLAIALQQQEFDQQQEQQSNPQSQPQRTTQQPPVAIGGSRLVTGPQVPRGGGKLASPSASKQESKSKERCIVM